MRKILPFVIGLIYMVQVDAQYLVSAEKVASNTVAEILVQFGVIGSYDVDSYKITYNTEDVLGNPTVASGLINVPLQSESTFPIAAFQHGTVDGRDDVPSRLDGGYQLGLIGSALGYLVVQADYIGLGDNPGVHPYVHWRSEATAARDLIRATKEFADSNSDVHYNDQVFITGYSQGGHGALALHKLLELEHNDEFTVTASSPMSGPYSISEEMVDFTLGDDEYLFCAYIVWTSMSMKAAYPDLLMDYELEDIFKPEFMDDINEFVNEEIGLFELNDRLIAQLRATNGIVTPKDLIFPDLVDAIKNDPNHPYSLALQDNDLDDWAPVTPTRLQYCSGDDQVTFRNAITAEQRMNDLGAADLIANENGPTLDHGGCVTPALLSTIAFFGGFAEVGMVSSVADINSTDRIQYFVDGNTITYKLEASANVSDRMKIHAFDMSGNRMNSYDVNNIEGSLYFENAVPGNYILILESDSRNIDLEKIFIH